MPSDASPSPSPDVSQRLQLAAALLADGRVDDATSAYNAILAERPDCAAARVGLGKIAAQRGALDEAAIRFEQALALAPDLVDALFGLAMVQQRQGDLENALASYKRAASIKADLIEALVNGAAISMQLGRVEEALALAQRAHAARPDVLETRWTLANALLRAGRLSEAIALYREIAALAPDEPRLLLNLGIALEHDGQLEAAEQSFRRAAAIAPALPEAHLQLGNIATARGDVARALGHFREAVALRPDFAEAHFNLACGLLSRGELRDGFGAYDWRLRLPGAPEQKLGAPRWSGDPAEIRGRTILLHAEQGLGDTLQFVRYADQLIRAGADIVLQVQRPLTALVARSFPTARVIAQDEAPPAFHRHCPLLSLPHVTGTTLDSIPASVPYISADPQRAREWAARLDRRARRIGIVWAGNPGHSNDRNRSIALSRFGPVLTGVDAAWYSLQVGPRAIDLKTISGLPVTDLAPALRDFEDTAAAIANLDLVISVDTAVCHLAGAMGRPVWVLLPFAPDWRWLLRGEASPWYPTMRLFRQRAPGDWDGVVADLLEALKLSI